jgi:hypothetical protein
LISGKAMLSNNKIYSVTKKPTSQIPKVIKNVMTEPEKWIFKKRFTIRWPKTISCTIKTTHNVNINDAFINDLKTAEPNSSDLIPTYALKNSQSHHHNSKINDQKEGFLDCDK